MNWLSRERIRGAACSDRISVVAKGMAFEGTGVQRLATSAQSTTNLNRRWIYYALRVCVVHDNRI